MKLTQKDRDALKEWAMYYEAGMHRTNQDVNLTQAEIARERERLEHNPVEWIKFFFPEYCTYEFAPFHLRAIRRCIRHDEWFEVLSWARSLAKSTTVMFIVLYLALTGKKRNVMMASATQDSAVRLLAPYKEMLENNGLLRAYYGTQVCPGNWSAEEFIAKCGCSFRAVGAGNAPRGQPPTVLCAPVCCWWMTSIRMKRAAIPTQCRRTGNGGKRLFILPVTLPVLCW